MLFFIYTKAKYKVCDRQDTMQASLAPTRGFVAPAKAPRSQRPARLLVQVRWLLRRGRSSSKFVEPTIYKLQDYQAS